MKRSHPTVRHWASAMLFCALAASTPADAATETVTLNVAQVAAGSAPSVDFPFTARSDQVFTAADLHLAFGRADLSSIQGLEVLVNSERIALLQPKDLIDERQGRVISIPPEDLADRNVLTLRFLSDDNGPCATIPPRTWGAIRSASLTTDSRPIPLPNDLALLPLPFVDRDHDKAGVVPIVFASTPTPNRVRLAGLVAGWLGRDVGLPLRFPVSIGELPDTSAVVLIDDTSAATALGLPAPEGPAAVMIDHPRHPGSNVKLLVLEGRSPAELGSIVRYLASGTALLAGQVLHPGPQREAVPSTPYDAPRWLPDGDIPFSSYPSKPRLALKGTRAGTISIPFRIAPDLWTWPAQYVNLKLGYSVDEPPGSPPPRLDVAFNGSFVATLPALNPARGETSGWTTLRIAADRFRGFNELQLHVAYPGVERCSASPSDDVTVSINPDSALQLKGLSHFASLPDVSMFVHDGYPFTRVADLGDTAVVLPDFPRAEELSTLFSTLAQFARVTGVIGTRLTVQTASAFLARPRIDKDLLVIGLTSDNAVLNRWADRMPIAFNSWRPHVRMPSQSNPVLRFLSGRMGFSEMRRARAVVASTRRFAAVIGWQSPAHPARSVVAMTATSLAGMPSIPDVAGFADARARDGDLLMASGGKRWMFRIGPSYDEGTLSRWTQLRWTLADHWIALLPCLLLGALSMGIGVRRGLARTLRARLTPGEKS